MFKAYDQEQMLLLPPALSDLVPEDHLARVVNDVVNEIDIGVIVRTYSSLGQDAYDPRMMLKVLFYGYATGIRSARKLAKRLREDVIFMWLAGMQAPDFRTLALFRQSRLSGIKEIFTGIVNVCIEMGLTQIGRICIDGTKIEANASGHKMVYAKTLRRRAVAITEKVEHLLKEAEETDCREDAQYGDKQGDELPGALRRREARLEKLKEAAKRIEEQAALLEERSNCSRTDPDANLMQMKRDYIYPGYNVQIATSDQIVITYEVSNQCNDTGLLIPQIEAIQAQYGVKPHTVIADKGYGTEENYSYLEQEGIDAYIPYPSLEKEKSKVYQQTPCNREQFWFDAKYGRVRCPQGYLMKEGKTETNAKTGHRTILFKGARCPRCQLQGQCTRGAYREYAYHPWLIQTKEKIKSKLSTKTGKALYALRKMDIEPVIGNIKHNLGFKKFLLRGLSKATIETGLANIAHNLIKIFKTEQKLKLAYA